MTPKTEASMRLARRALHGVDLLSVAERIQVFEDVAFILPLAEAERARLTAFTLRQSEKLQGEFLELFK